MKSKLYKKIIETNDLSDLVSYLQNIEHHYQSACAESNRINQTSYSVTEFEATIKALRSDLVLAATVRLEDQVSAPRLNFDQTYDADRDCDLYHDYMQFADRDEVIELSSYSSLEEATEYYENNYTLF